MAVRTIPVLAGYAQRDRRARAGGVGHQLHQPGRHRHAGDAARRRPEDRRHLRHADRAVRGDRARARRAGGGVRVRLLRPESSRLGARGLSPTARPLLGASGTTTRCCARIYSRPLFPPAYLATLRLLPTEYVYYYEFPDARSPTSAPPGTSRGAVVSRADRPPLRRSRRGDRRSGCGLRSVPGRAVRVVHADRVRPAGAESAVALGRAHRLRPDRLRRDARDRAQHATR